MVSFCDVPIFKNDEHSARYGNYTLAISKEYLYNKYPNCAPVRDIRSDDPIFSVKACLSIKDNALNEIERLISGGNDLIIDELSNSPQIIAQLDNKVLRTISYNKLEQIFERENDITSMMYQ